MMNLTNRATLSVSGIPSRAASSWVIPQIVCSSIDPSSGRVVGHIEEGVVALVAEVFQRADADDPVDLALELLPALQPHLDVAVRRDLGQLGLRVRAL
jgi:hypothetical protein